MLSRLAQEEEMQDLNDYLINGRQEPARYDLRGDLIPAKHRDVEALNLSGKDLSQLNWRKISGARGNFIYLKAANLSRTNLKNAQLAGMDLRWVNFSNSNLQNVNFSGADLQYANFRGASLRGADLRRANLVGVTDANFIEAITDAHTAVRQELSDLCIAYMNLMSVESNKRAIVNTLLTYARQSNFQEFLRFLNKNASTLSARKYELKGDAMPDKAFHAGRIFLKSILAVLGTITIIPTLTIRICTGEWLHDRLFSVDGRDFVKNAKQTIRTMQR